MNQTLSGGCQCGAVRFRVERLGRGSVCHCRMCQKAFGSFFAPLTGVPLDKFEITRGTMAMFASSDKAERGFCRNCGTPLSFRYLHSQRIAVSIGSLDEPARVKPENQYGIEARLPYFAELAALPGDKTTEDDAPELAVEIRNTGHQHPDHDTLEWPPPASVIPAKAGNQ